jgi:predicted branched-subunit amino acid permease
VSTVAPQRRRAIWRDAIGIGLATGAYAISFGAIAVAAGLSVAQTQALSGLMFTGASQFALVGVLGAGGGAVAAIAIAALLGTRNAFYALHMVGVLSPRGWRRLAAAQLTIDESTGMAIGYEEDRSASRLAFWATGISVFVLWNLGTLVGALGADVLGDPARFGLDAAIPAAFLALLWPRLDTRLMRIIAVIAAAVALALTPVLSAGLPVLIAGGIAVAFGIAVSRGTALSDESTIDAPDGGEG